MLSVCLDVHHTLVAFDVCQLFCLQWFDTVGLQEEHPALTFLVSADPGCPGKETVKWVSVCLQMKCDSTANGS